MKSSSFAKSDQGRKKKKKGKKREKDKVKAMFAGLQEE